MHHSPCALRLPASRAPCCVPQVLLVLLYEPCSTTRDESCNDVNDEPCADPAPSQNDLFTPVFEAVAAELGDEIPLARINGNLVPRAIQQYGSTEVLHYGAADEPPRRTRGLAGGCTPELVVFRHGRDFRYRSPALPTQEELVRYMRSEAELAREVNRTLALALTLIRTRTLTLTLALALALAQNPSPSPSPHPKPSPSPHPHPKQGRAIDGGARVARLGR